MGRAGPAWPGVEPALLPTAWGPPHAPATPAYSRSLYTEQFACCQPGRRLSGMLPDPGAQLICLGPAPLPAPHGAVPMFLEGMPGSAALSSLKAHTRHFPTNTPMATSRLSGKHFVHPVPLAWEVLASQAGVPWLSLFSSSSGRRKPPRPGLESPQRHPKILWGAEWAQGVTAFIHWPPAPRDAQSTAAHGPEINGPGLKVRVLRTAASGGVTGACRWADQTELTRGPVQPPAPPGHQSTELEEAPECGPTLYTRVGTHTCTYTCTLCGSAVFHRGQWGMLGCLLHGEAAPKQQRHPHGCRASACSSGSGP